VLLTQNCFEEVEKAEAKWLERIIDMPLEGRRPFLTNLPGKDLTEKQNVPAATTNN
jgi:hypothetical protein